MYHLRFEVEPGCLCTSVGIFIAIHSGQGYWLVCPCHLGRAKRACHFGKGFMVSFLFPAPIEPIVVNCGPDRIVGNLKKFARWFDWLKPNKCDFNYDLSLSRNNHCLDFDPMVAVKPRSLLVPNPDDDDDADDGSTFSCGSGTFVDSVHQLHTNSSSFRQDPTAWPKWIPFIKLS